MVLAMCARSGASDGHKCQACQSESIHPPRERVPYAWHARGALVTGQGRAERRRRDSCRCRIYCEVSGPRPNIAVSYVRRTLTTYVSPLLCKLPRPRCAPTAVRMHTAYRSRRRGQTLIWDVEQPGSLRRQLRGQRCVRLQLSCWADNDARRERGGHARKRRTRRHMRALWVRARVRRAHRDSRRGAACAAWWRKNVQRATRSRKGHKARRWCAHGGPVPGPYQRCARAADQAGTRPQRQPELREVDCCTGGRAACVRAPRSHGGPAGEAAAAHGDACGRLLDASRAARTRMRFSSKGVLSKTRTLSAPTSALHRRARPGVGGRPRWRGRFTWWSRAAPPPAPIAATTGAAPAAAAAAVAALRHARPPGRPLLHGRRQPRARARPRPRRTPRYADVVLPGVDANDKPVVWDG